MSTTLFELNQALEKLDETKKSVINYKDNDVEAIREIGIRVFTIAEKFVVEGKKMHIAIASKVEVALRKGETTLRNSPLLEDVKKCTLNLIDFNVNIIKELKMKKEVKL